MMNMNMHLLVALLATVSVSAKNHDFRGEQRELTAASPDDYPITLCPDSPGDEFGPRANTLSVNECTTTAFVSKGIKPAWPLEKEDSGYKDFIENVMYQVGVDSTEQKSIGQYLNEVADVDSFLVYHGGKLVYENYLWDEQNVSSRHFLYSATKSFVGMVATDMYSRGLLNLDKPVDFYLEKEDLDSEAFSGDDVTVEMVLDMTNQYVWTEGGLDDCDLPSFFSYASTFNELNGTPFKIPPGCEMFGAYQIADGMTQLTNIFVEERANSGVEPFGWPGPTNKRDLIEMLKRGNKPNGDEWVYRTASVDVMAMIIDKVLKETDDCVLRGYVCTLREYFGEKILSSVGLDHDVLVTTDNAMSLNWGRGGSATARDMLRLGVMLLNDGKNREGEEVLSRKALDYIFDGSDKSRRNFVNQGSFLNQWSTSYDLCNGNIGDSCGWSYNAYFRSFNPSGKEGGGEIAYMEGFYGQVVWIDREADLVMAMMVEDATNTKYWASPFHALTKAFRAEKATNHSKKSAKMHAFREKKGKKHSKKSAEKSAHKKIKKSF